MPVTIEVELYGGLAEHQPRKQRLPADIAVSAADVARLLGLPLESIGLLTIDGVQSEPEDPVPNGARICFFPFLSGG